MANNQRQKETPVTEEKKGKRKWLDRFVTFLVMGGFILIIALIVGIIIGVSMLTKGC